MLAENKAAAATLQGMYWSSTGWKQPPEEPAREDWKQAVDAGYMFDDIELEHDDLISRIKQLAETISLGEAAAC